MDTPTLMTKLIEIEHAIGIEESFKVHKMVLEAQECLLQMDRESCGPRRTNPRQD
jgi:hypothetical protein